MIARALARRLRCERGVTLIELIATTTMMVAVGGAVLTALTEFESTTRNNGIQNDAQQEARRSLNELTRELRNLASPTDELPQAVEKATGSDIVFLAVGDTKPAGSLNSRNTRRVRYCVDPSGGHFWRQQQTWTTASAPAAPSTSACPASTGTGWGAAKSAADYLANGSRAVFTYNSAELASITEIRSTLYIDIDTAKRPRETKIETAVFLRNQNRGPSSSFTATVNGSQIVLNGSASSDPEGKALGYEWYDGGTLVGEGIVITYAPSSAGDHSMTLKVRDPAGLTSTAPAQTVCIVSPTTPCS